MQRPLLFAETQQQPLRLLFVSILSTMSSKQDRETTERFTKTLRELVKRPENKLCVDCKRNGQFLLHR